MSSTVTIEFDLSASSLRTAAGASGTESVWLSRLTGVPNCWLSSILKFMPSSARSGVFALAQKVAPWAAFCARVRSWPCQRFIKPTPAR